MVHLPGDLRFAVRTLRRSPAFTVSVVATLALGIAATTAIFSVVNKVLLEPLPYAEPDRLAQLITTSWVGDQYTVSIQKYAVWKAHTQAFQLMAAYDPGGFAANLATENSAEAVEAMRVSADYFRLFGARAMLGRTFSEQEDRPGGPLVVVISNRLWLRYFRGDRAAVGSAIKLDGEPHKIIGVLASGPVVDGLVDIWMPLRADPSVPDFASRVRVAARLLPGVTMERAAGQTANTIIWYLSEHPYAPLLFRERFTAIPLRDALVGDVRPALVLLLAAVGFVLLVSCANAANLMLARGARRTREIAIRAALGAQRRQIVRQLLVESLSMSFVAGLAGLAAGYLGVKELLLISPSGLPRIGADGSAIALDWRVYLFTAIVSVFTGVLFGLAPALKSARPKMNALVQDRSLESGMRLGRGGATLVVGEIAAVLVLLVGAGLLIRTFVAKRTAGRGFDEQDVLTLQMSLNGPQFQKTAAVAELIRRVGQRLRHVPGVSSIATTSALPLEPNLTMPFSIWSRDRSFVGRYHGAAEWRSVSPGYFSEFRIHLLGGRLFSDGDDEHRPGVVLINRIMMTLLTVFGGIALLLAVVGLYGLMLYSVEQRTREIGVRLALGATPENVRSLVLWQGLRLVALGMLIGIPAALALTRVMVSLIFGIATWDPLVLAAVVLLLGSMTLIAAWLPSRRATRVDPVEALRC